ncbi:glycosyltransferase, partial [Candidatus Gottesmanbacteria bacterium]|nr:glycosyltransferase [Candidatus Gottesmanbacteria bacterium]
KKTYKKHKDFKLIIAGKIDKKSLPYYKHLLTLTERRGDISFVLSPADTVLQKLYAQSTAVVLPSFNEDWGIAALEANASAKPVIAINSGGHTESQIDGVTGFLVPPRYGDAVAKMHILANNKELVDKMGKNGRKNAQRYSWNHFVTRIDTILAAVASLKTKRQ